MTDKDLDKMINNEDDQVLDNMVNDILVNLPEELRDEAKQKCFELCEETPVVTKKITLKVPNASQALQAKLNKFNVSVLCVEG